MAYESAVPLYLFGVVWHASGILFDFFAHWPRRFWSAAPSQTMTTTIAPHTLSIDPGRRLHYWHPVCRSWCWVDVDWVLCDAPCAGERHVQVETGRWGPVLVSLLAVADVAGLIVCEE